jgi:hypothetical protein
MTGPVASEALGSMTKGTRGMSSPPDLSGVLERLRDEKLLPAGALAVLCVGSVARGWANERSDYDLVVVTHEPFTDERVRSLPVPLEPGILPTVGVRVDGRRWEIKYWLDAHVDQMLAKITWERFEAGAHASRVLIDVEELALERLVSCITLTGDAWVETRRRELAGSAFRSFAVSRSLAGMDSAVEDALGQLGASDVESAVLSARRAVGHVVDALLESYGCYGSAQPKWRARRFREATPAEVPFGEYWALETMRDLDPAMPKRWVEQTVQWCRRLCMEVEV